MSRHHSNRKGLGSWLGAALLNVLAVLGVLCIVLVILSFVFNISIMMFKTGSMSPTIPAGSIAFVHEIPTEDMEVGDIVTVDRGENVLPVTHRVVDILESDDRTGEVTFELRGDANETKDPDPYTAETVRKVIFSVPGIAPVIQKLRNPFALGGITIAATILVVWAFWPRRGDDEDEPEESIDDAAARVESLRSPERSPKHALATPVIAALIVSGSGLFGANLPTIAQPDASGSQSAGAEDSSSEVHGDFLRMRAFGDEAQMRNLSPGTSASWSVDVWTEAPDPGTVSLEIGSGQITEAIASSLLVDVQACERSAPEGDCPKGARSLLSGIPLTDLGQAPDGNRPLLEMTSDEDRRIEVTVTLASDADARAVAGLTSSVRLTAIGHGEEVSLGPGDPGPDEPDLPGELPWTGIRGWQWILLAAVVLIVVGSAVVARTRRSRKS